MKLRRMLGLVLTLLVVAALLPRPAAAVPEDQVVSSGPCGNGVN